MLPIHIAHFQQDEVSIQESELQQAGKEEVCVHTVERLHVTFHDQSPGSGVQVEQRPSV